MSMLDQIIGGATDLGPVKEIAAKFGIDPQQATAAIASLVPALAGGLQRNAGAPGGLDQLLAALRGGGHQKYVDDPSTLTQPEAVQDGNSILGHILGSKDVSRQVAQQASAKTGIGADILKQMLPVVAGLVMGHLSKQQAAAPATPDQPASGGAGGLLGSLSGMLGLDADHDGKVEAGDLLKMAGKIL